MAKQLTKKVTESLWHWSDFSASVVVFFVALPLCLGIALASGAPLLSGVIAGIVGGLVVGLISKSALSISGPAAGLTAIMVQAQAQLGDFNLLLVAIFLAGVFQIVLGAIKAGFIRYLFPFAVIKGMLAAIGFILIWKQLPLFLGFIHDNDLWDVLPFVITDFSAAALFIGLLSLGVLLFWQTQWIKKTRFLAFMPGALIAVLLATLLNLALVRFTSIGLTGDSLVQLPLFDNVADFFNALQMPNWSGLKVRKVYGIAITLALVASIETLLSVDAADRLDGQKRITPANRELFAQGIGNAVSACLGGLPITAVIVRSAANIEAGAQSKLAGILHGFWLLLAVLFLGSIINYIPLPALAALLLLVGYQLCKPTLFKKMYAAGMSQFVPFLVTLIAVVLTDLLIGMALGFFVGITFVMLVQTQGVLALEQQGDYYRLIFKKDATFLTKAVIIRQLDAIPPQATLELDFSGITYVDADIREAIATYVTEAPSRKISVRLIQLPNVIG